MYSYHSGEIKNPGLELMLVLVRLIGFAALIFITAGAGIAAGLPHVVSGTVAGLFAVGLLVSGSFLEVISYKCPNCGTVTKSIKNYGSYQCPVCGTKSFITRDELTKL
ncbi:hypothetical protein DCCM_3178 [Desulfocucumis palustris]|uniref:Uncharacterized protein n=1 Tax=Desulfocucumis palustris TaxID=1898651 RepID=A0A2L2XIK7_9FIRM|nr:hypothetical protein [Desulfocucumis palustris]GBF34066.1 hypothetical protein DCCM_3178 [Desulfocucumis palustris]